jgi:hypothetical protein
VIVQPPRGVCLTSSQGGKPMPVCKLFRKLHPALIVGEASATSTRSALTFSSHAPLSITSVCDDPPFAPLSSAAHVRWQHGTVFTAESFGWLVDRGLLRYIRYIFVYRRLRPVLLQSRPDSRGSSHTGHEKCFTICLCIRPDLDGYRAPKVKHGPRKTRKGSRNGITKRLRSSIMIL